MGKSIRPLIAKPVQTLRMKIVEPNNTLGQRNNALDDGSVRTIFSILITLVSPRVLDRERGSHLSQR